MPRDDPDPQDPMLLVGVGLPGDAGSRREMAWAFAEEFARMGCGVKEILGLFREPFYAGAHRAFRELGEAEVGAIIEEAVGVWGRLGKEAPDVPAAPAGGGGGDIDEQGP